MRESGIGILIHMGKLLHIPRSSDAVLVNIDIEPFDDYILRAVFCVSTAYLPTQHIRHHEFYL